MDISYFLKKYKEEAWTSQPCLYIVKSDASDDVYRCGASGVHLYPDADPVYSSSKPTTGLQSRMTMYNNYWAPVTGKIYAALTVKQMLVAAPTDRVSSLGYNITNPTRTLVREREAQFHAELDRRGLRWDEERKNELFRASSIESLLAAMRTIDGGQMYVFNALTYDEDTARRSRRHPQPVRPTTTRSNPVRASTVQKRVPTIRLKLDRSFVENLRTGSKQHYEKLLNIMADLENERVED